MVVEKVVDVCRERLVGMENGVVRGRVCCSLYFHNHLRRCEGLNVCIHALSTVNAAT